MSKVAAFVEQPDAATAAEYVTQNYLWNSENSLFRLLLSELARFEPSIADAIETAVAGARKDLGFVRIDPGAFARSPQKSIDYAVMEKDRAAVFENQFRWPDHPARGLCTTANDGRAGLELCGTPPVSIQTHWDVIPPRSKSARRTEPSRSQIHIGSQPR